MNVIYPVAGFWIGLIFLVLGYLLKKKKCSKLFLQISMATFFIALILFMWWAVLRMMGVTT